MNIGRAAKIAERHALARALRGDPIYLDHLARHLAELAGLPLPLARRRVLALAISAQPRPVGTGFLDRSV